MIFGYRDMLIEMIKLCNEKITSINQNTDYIDYYTSLKEHCEKCLKDFDELV